MRFGMKRLLRLLWIVIVGAVIAIALNDGARYGQAVIDLDNSTNNALTQTVAIAGKAPSNVIANELGQQAQIQKIRITQYAIMDGKLHVWSEEDVKGTWVLGPYMAMAKGAPFSKAFSTGYTIKHEAQQALR